MFKINSQKRGWGLERPKGERTAEYEYPKKKSLFKGGGFQL
jgi:hypothetical protein